MRLRGIPQEFELYCKLTNRRVHVAERYFQMGSIGTNRPIQQIDRECQYTTECQNNGVNCLFAYGSRDPRF